MNILHSVGKIINRYGCAAAVENSGKLTQTRGFLQPLRYKNNEYADSLRHCAGEKKQGLYLFICTNEATLVPGSTVIEIKDCKYIVKRSETYFVSDCPVYKWAVLCRAAEALEDDYEPN